MNPIYDGGLDITRNADGTLSISPATHGGRVTEYGDADGNYHITGFR
jgi:hypothetical protein